MMTNVWLLFGNWYLCVGNGGGGLLEGTGHQLLPASNSSSQAFPHPYHPESTYNGQQAAKMDECRRKPKEKGNKKAMPYPQYFADMCPIDLSNFVFYHNYHLVFLKNFG